MNVMQAKEYEVRLLLPSQGCNMPYAVHLCGASPARSLLSARLHSSTAFNRKNLPFFSLTLECERRRHPPSSGRVQTVAWRPAERLSHSSPNRDRGLNPASLLRIPNLP